MMFRFTFFAFFLLSSARCQLTATERPRELSFTIERTWDGKPVSENETVSIVLSGGESSKDVTVRIDAPFYDDPAPKEVKPFLGLWNYEVVQVFFLNSDDQYLEVEIGPYGQHIVLLMDGQRRTIRHSLPLNVSTSIEDSRWVADAIIPADYFPLRVTKFNAYALNGVGIDRQYLALYPANDSATEPDLHNLDIFQPVDFGILSLGEDTELSPIWESALQGRSQYARRIFSYKISRQWNDFRTIIPPTTASLQGFEGGVEINYTIPANKDPYPFEAFVIAFENDAGEATKLRLHVDGSYFVDLFVDRKTKINAENLPLDYRVDLRDAEYVKGSALVPPSYYAPKVKIMNMYVLFGVESMIAMSLQPINVLGQVAFKPDLNSLEHFTPIDFDLLVQSNLEYSDIWRKMLNISSKPEKEDPFTTEVSQYEVETSTQEVTTLPGDSFDTTQSDARESETTQNVQEDKESERGETTKQPETDIETIIEEILNYPKLAEEEEVKDEVNEQKEDVHETQTEIAETSATQMEANSSAGERLEDSNNTTLTTGENGSPDGRPEEDQSLKALPQSQPQFNKPLRFLLRRRNPQPQREDYPRRYEESKSDQNELPITFQITIKSKEQAVETSPSFPQVLPEVTLDKDEKIMEDFPLDESPFADEEEPIEVDYVSGFLPPPHPICFTEGLVQDSFRCQIFYECVIENGKWEVYRWRCKRGFFYDPETVACVRGIC